MFTFAVSVGGLAVMGMTLHSRLNSLAAPLPGNTFGKRFTYMCCCYWAVRL